MTIRSQHFAPNSTALDRHSLLEPYETHPFGNVFAGRVRCVLQIGRSNLPIDLPAEILEKHRMLAADEVRLRIPGEEELAVDVVPLLSSAQQRTSDAWLREMQDFDRF
ncbi:MAG: hypothetical protein KY476_21400 [Planctomycetes bacterium]|nr:hypothetical protein [Planctomycetota bacterium]